MDIYNVFSTIGKDSPLIPAQGRETVDRNAPIVVCVGWKPRSCVPGRRIALGATKRRHFTPNIRALNTFLYYPNNTL